MGFMRIALAGESLSWLDEWFARPFTIRGIEAREIEEKPATTPIVVAGFEDVTDILDELL
jgi:hypothetical protein